MVDWLDEFLAERHPEAKGPEAEAGGGGDWLDEFLAERHPEAKAGGGGDWPPTSLERLSDVGDWLDDFLEERHGTFSRNGARAAAAQVEPRRDWDFPPARTPGEERELAEPMFGLPKGATEVPVAGFFVNPRTYQRPREKEIAEQYKPYERGRGVRVAGVDIPFETPVIGGLLEATMGPDVIGETNPALRVLKAIGNVLGQPYRTVGEPAAGYATLGIQEAGEAAQRALIAAGQEPGAIARAAMARAEKRAGAQAIEGAGQAAEVGRALLAEAPAVTQFGLATVFDPLNYVGGFGSAARKAAMARLATKPLSEFSALERALTWVNTFGHVKVPAVAEGRVASAAELGLKPGSRLNPFEFTPKARAIETVDVAINNYMARTVDLTAEQSLRLADLLRQSARAGRLADDVAREFPDIARGLQSYEGQRLVRSLGELDTRTLQKALDARAVVQRAIQTGEALPAGVPEALQIAHRSLTNPESPLAQAFRRGEVNVARVLDDAAKAQLRADVAGQVGEFARRAFNLSPNDNTLVKLRDSLKAFEAGIFLGGNPPALVQNWLNNKTMTALHGLPVRGTIADALKMWKSWGYDAMPDIVKAVTGKSASAAGYAGALERKSWNPIMRLWEKVETTQRESNLMHATYYAYKSAMAQVARGMPADLRAALAGINPRLPKIVEGAIAAGYTKADVLRALHGALPLTLEAYVDDLARARRMDPEALRAMLVQSGLWGEVNDALRGARTADEFAEKLRAIVERAAQEVKDARVRVIDAEVVQRGASTGARTAAGARVTRMSDQELGERLAEIERRAGRTTNAKKLTAMRAEAEEIGLEIERRAAARGARPVEDPARAAVAPEPVQPAAPVTPGAPPPGPAIPVEGPERELERQLAPEELRRFRERILRDVEIQPRGAALPAEPGAIARGRIEAPWERGITPAPRPPEYDTLKSIGFSDGEIGAMTSAQREFAVRQYEAVRSDVERGITFAPGDVYEAGARAGLEAVPPARVGPVYTIEDVRQAAGAKGIGTATEAGVARDRDLLALLNERRGLGAEPFSTENLPHRAEEAMRVLESYRPGVAPALDREGFLAAAGERFGLSEAQARDYARIVDARAEVWAKHTGQSVEDYYASHFAGAVAGPRPSTTRGAPGLLEVPELGPRLTEFRHDARGAIRRLIELQGGDAVAALHHPQIGDIDLIWGATEAPGRRGFGLAKIVEEHPEVVDRLQEIVGGMPVKSGSKYRVVLESGTHYALLSLDWKGRAKRWLLTAYEKKGFAPPRGPIDVSGSLRQRAGTAPSLQSETARIISQTQREVNAMLAARGLAKGGTTFLSDGRAILRAYEAADLSTLVHETAHVFFGDLDADAAGVVARWAGLEDDLFVLHSKRIAGELTREEAAIYTQAQEKFARGFERYLAEGVAPAPELQGVFERFKEWLVAIYKQITGSAIDVEISPEVRGVLDSLLADVSPTSIARVKDVGGVEGAGRAPVPARAPPQGPRALQPPAGGLAQGPSPTSLERLSDVGGPPLLQGREAHPFGMPAGAEGERLGGIARRLDELALERDAARKARQPLKARRIEQEIERLREEYSRAYRSADELFQAAADDLADAAKPREGAPLFAADEITAARYAPMVDVLRDLVGQARNDFDILRGAQVRGADAATARLLDGWLASDVFPAMADARAVAGRIGRWMEERSLVNYNARINFDDWASWGVPFGYWPRATAGNFAFEFLNRPGLLANFLRAREALDRIQAEEGFPKRFRGRIKVPMPFVGLAPWMEDGLYFDPLRDLLPIDRFLTVPQQMLGYFGVSDRDVAQEVRGMAQRGEITSEQAELAIRQKNDLWRRVGEELKGQGGADPFDVASLFTSVHFPLDWAHKALTGRADEISYLIPLSRQLKGGSAILGEAFPNLAIPPGGFDPEGALRERLGVPKGDPGESYRIDRMLASMAADGSVSERQARRALIERRGAVFDAARQRASVEAGVGALGGYAGLYSLRGMAYGETLDMQLKAELDSLLDKEVTRLGYDPKALATTDKWEVLRRFKATGSESAVGKWFDQHPEYQARSALFKEPEERLAGWLTEEFWDRYNKLPALDKRLFREQTQDAELKKFIDKTTRDYKAVPLMALERWVTALRGYVPEAPQIKQTFTPEQLQALISPYAKQKPEYADAYAEWLKHYTLIKDEQAAYMKLPERSQARRDYLAQHPTLSEYFKWNADFWSKHPELARLLGREEKPAIAAAPARGGGAPAPSRAQAGVLPPSGAQWEQVRASLAAQDQELADLVGAWLSRAKPDADLLALRNPKLAAWLATKPDWWLAALKQSFLAYLTSGLGTSYNTRVRGTSVRYLPPRT